MNTNGGRGITEGAQGPYGIAPPGYRLPADVRLGRVVLQIADLERSLDYYGRVLGLGVLERSGGRARLGVRGGEGVLIELREKPGAISVPRRGRIGLYHFAILLPDRPSLGRFVRHLAESGVRAGASDHLVSEALYLQDPDGLGIEVYADRPRETWSHRERQLVMATDPLDLGAVVRAAGAQPWEGMPAGARIGHVHLHVGDLAEAEAFYHRALGFDKVVWSYPGALFLSAGGYHHHLGVNTWAAGSPAATEHDARLIEWWIVLPEGGEVSRVVESLENQGLRVESEDGHGARVEDPWGTPVRLIAEGPV